jgi:hypothetical protein
MVVCVQAELGFFFRINSRPNWQQSVPLKREPDHKFLDHDSYLECGEPFELDEYVVDQSLDDRGVIGIIASALLPDILIAVVAAQLLSAKDKAAIFAFLDPTGAYRQLLENDDFWNR